MALDKQVTIYSVDTGNFYSKKERHLHDLNCKLRMEKNDLRDKLKTLKEEILEENPNAASLIILLDKNKNIPYTSESEEDKIIKYMLYSKCLKDKRKRIKKSKQDLLKLMNRKIVLNEQTNGSHHTRVLKDNLTINNTINIFDSSITRLFNAQPYELVDNLIVVQVYYFDVFKDIFYYGFTFKGEKYIYLTSSAGQIRTKKGVFIKESFYKKHEKTLMCGLTLDVINAKGGNNPNKHLAYMALNNSATDEWSDFDIDKTIVIDDFETMVHGTYDLVDEVTYTVQRMVGDIPVPHTDGAGMILPSLSKYNFMIRMPWVKGLLGVFDFKMFIKEKGYSPVIKDIYGIEHDIIKEDIQIIFTKSQFKLWKYYSSWEEYKTYFKQFNCKAGVCNHECTNETGHIPNVSINYQMLQTLTDFTEKELQEIIKRSNTNIKSLCSSVRNLQRAFQVTPSNHHMTYLQQAIQIYPDLINDEYLKNNLREIKKSLIKKAKSGKLLVKGKYTFLLPDFYAACEYWFGNIENPTGLLSDQEVYCRLFDDSKELDCLRSPHLDMAHAIRKNIAYVEEERRKEVGKWFNTDGIYTSTHDLISKILQFDVDGDNSLVVADETLIKVAKRNLQKFDVVPLYYNMKKAKPVQLTKENIYHGLILAFVGGNIGMYSNDISKIWNSGIFQHGTENEQKEALNIIKILCMENNFVIDK